MAHGRDPFNRLNCSNLLRFVIGWKDWSHFHNQPNLKRRQSFVTRSHAFFRPWSGLNVFASSADWFSMCCLCLLVLERVITLVLISLHSTEHHSSPLIRTNLNVSFYRMQDTQRQRVKYKVFHSTLMKGHWIAFWKSMQDSLPVTYWGKFYVLVYSYGDSFYLC